MKFAFICLTPYQLLNMVNFVYHDVEKSKGHSDIYIAINKRNSNIIKEQLINLDIFNHIYIVNPQKHYKNKVISKIHSLYVFVFENHYFRKQVVTSPSFKKTKYDIAVIASATLLCEAFVNYFKPSKVYFIDDGLGSYSGNIQNRTITREHLLFAKLFNRHFVASKLYVNNVDFCESELTNNIVPLPRIEDISYQKILKKLFDYKENEFYSDHKLIYINQPLGEINLEYEKKECEIFVELSNAIKENMVVRLHPREINRKKYDKCIIDSATNMWEMVCMNEITCNHILLGMCSTAQVISKMLYNKEPFVIFTYGLFPPDEVNFGEKSALFEQVRNSYSNPDKVFAPKSIDELKNILNQLLGL